MPSSLYNQLQVCQFLKCFNFSQSEANLPTLQILRMNWGSPRLLRNSVTSRKCFYCRTGKLGKPLKLSLTVCVKGPNVQRAGFAVTLNNIKYHAPLEIHPFHP